jgi:uncharacterized phage protein (TIGR02218 family)
MTAKTLASGIGAIVDSGSGALAWALEVIRLDTVAVRYCTGSRSVTIDGNIFTPVTGAEFSNIASTLGLQVNNLIITVGDNDVMLREDVLDGLWDGSKFRIFQYDQLSPTAGIIPWHKGFIADLSPRIGAFSVEARDFRQALHQDTTRTHQFGCSYELGDAKCRKDLTAFTFTAVAVTGVTNASQFTCSSLGQATNFFTEGKLLFTTGPSANGIWRKIAAHTSGGLITLDKAAIKGVGVGNLLTIIAGCMHRPNEDCRDKFANKVNYGGCDTKPTVTDLITGKAAA